MKTLGRWIRQPGKDHDNGKSEYKKKSTQNSVEEKGIKKKSVKWKHSDWQHAFTPVRRRVLTRHMLNYMSAGILAALAITLILFALSFLFPFENLLYFCLSLSLLAFGLVLATGWWRRPSAYEVARIVDKLGLHEKVLTACELDERDDTMAELQRKDAIESLSTFDKKRISYRVPKFHGFVFILLTLALVMVNFIPNPMNRLIQQRQELRAEIQHQLEELKKTQEELAAQETLTEEQRQELAKLVEDLAEQLKQTGDYKEALKEISKAEEELAALTDKIREESIGQLVEQLGALEETNALAKALSDRNLANLESELEQLKEQLEQAANKDELTAKLQEALEKALETMADGKMKDDLTSASTNLTSGQISAAIDQLGGAMKQAVNASNAMGDARYAMQQMRSSIAQAAGEAQLAQNTGGQSGQNSNSENQNSVNQSSGSADSGNSGQGSSPGQSGEGSGSGQGQGAGEGNGSGQGQSAGQGQGQGTGQGQGSGGQSGSGVGSGTTNNSSGQGGSGTTGNQNGNSQMGDEGAQTVYEQIYAPERLGDGGEVTHVPGQQTGEGDITREDDRRGLGDFSGYIPYKDVYQEYRNEAMNSVDRRVLPPNIQEIVRQYFDALGQ